MAAKSPRILASVCAVASVVLATEVSAAEAAPASAASLHIDACALLLPSEISQVIGLPVDAGARNDAGMESTGAYSSACVWTIQREEAPSPDPTAPLNGKSFVILNAMQWPPGSDLARTFLEAFRKAAAHGDIPNQPSPRSIGDEALWWGDGLAVRTGDVSFGISVFLPGRVATRPGAFEERLVPHILRRLVPGDASSEPPRDR